MAAKQTQIGPLDLGGGGWGRGNAVMVHGWEGSVWEMAHQLLWGPAAGPDSAPPSLPAALSLQDTLFPDVGGTRALVSELERK